MVGCLLTFVVAQADPEWNQPAVDRTHLQAMHVYLPTSTHDAFPIVVANSGSRAVDAGVVGVPEQLFVDAQAPFNDLGILTDDRGKAVAYQVDGNAPNGEFCFRTPSIPAYGARTYYWTAPLPRNAFIAKRQSVDPGQPQVLVDGAFKVTREAGKPDLDLSIDGVSLGTFDILIESKSAGPNWIGPTAIDRIDAYDNGVLKTYDLTVAYRDGATPYRVCFRIAAEPGKPWFTSRLLWVENTGTTAWTLAAYYHYPLSSIDGAVDDAPVAADGAGAWFNAKAGVYYGVDAPDFKISLWRDSDNHEHPDVWRDIEHVLRPGERYEVPQPAVTVFGVRGDKAALVDQVARLRARSSIVVTVERRR